MPTKKIADVEQVVPCRNPEHEPAKHIVRSPGVYEHTCPGCGATMTFTVRPGPWLGSQGVR